MLCKGWHEASGILVGADVNVRHMQDRGQWTEDYARWRRRNSIAPDAKVLSLFRLPTQLCAPQQGMCNRLQRFVAVLHSNGIQSSCLRRVNQNHMQALALPLTKLCRPDLAEHRGV